LRLAFVLGEHPLEVFILSEEFLICGFLRGELLFKCSDLILKHIQILPLLLPTAYSALPVLLTFSCLPVRVWVSLEVVLTGPVTDLVLHVFLFLFG